MNYEINTLMSSQHAIFPRPVSTHCIVLSIKTFKNIRVSSVPQPKREGKIYSIVLP